MKLVKKKLLKNVFYLLKRKVYIAFYWKAHWAMSEVNHPHVIEIELTNNCNFRCVHCHRLSMDRKVGNMDFSLFTKIIDEIATYPVAFLRIVGQGESALHPLFRKMMQYVSGKSIKIELTTNGSIFDLYSFEEILEWDIDILGISLDGPDKASYLKIRKGGNYDKLTNNILNFYTVRNKTNKKYPLVCLRNVIFPENTSEQLREFKEHWQNFVDEISFNTLSTYEQSFNHSYLSHDRCNELFFDAHIRYDGSVLLCQHQFLYGHNEIIGNMKTQNLRQIWKSNRLIDMRLLHLKRDFPRACKMCFCNTKRPENYVNARKYNVSKNKIVNAANKVINIT